MQLRKFPSSISLLWVLALTGCAHARKDGTDELAAYRAERSHEVETLVAQATPSDLAAAALLAAPGDLIEEQIAAHLQVLDPDNGFVWTVDLERAQSSGSDTAVTAAIVRISAGSRMTFYWNQLEVMMVDAMAVANPSQSLVERGTVAIGVLAAQAIPALQPMSKACRLAQLDLPGRRAACEAMVARMEQSSTVLTQSLAISLQERWWPAGSPQRDILRAKRRRLDYLMSMSSRIRWGRMNRDMTVRIDAARHTDREEDVELAIVKSFGLPPEPPLNWKDSLHPG